MAVEWNRLTFANLQIWPALWDYRHPNAPCFTTPVQPRRNALRSGSSDASVATPATAKDPLRDVFIGAVAPVPKLEKLGNGPSGPFHGIVASFDRVFLSADGHLRFFKGRMK